ncbi:uncharacterized protein BDW43DRAFT_229294 [Aspergillus alliaceus]|uniref:uncharacterized protein n=1 Tax=Petromyces alliaceus TaxID=209559 RepID=UPI0012A75B87|nr:uncharacterized protein BDW43DRAFT_229294 [Aspergillus alliaceus]KAB8237045.1 hypothetical protein BDW43DRAFT_229294 [Aspergillus alliaceus]
MRPGVRSRNSQFLGQRMHLNAPFHSIKSSRKRRERASKAVGRVTYGTTPPSELRRPQRGGDYFHFPLCFISTASLLVGWGLLRDNSVSSNAHLGHSLWISQSMHLHLHGMRHLRIVLARSISSVEKPWLVLCFSRMSLICILQMCQRAFCLFLSILPFRILFFV